MHGKIQPGSKDMTIWNVVSALINWKCMEGHRWLFKPFADLINKRYRLSQIFGCHLLMPLSCFHVLKQMGKKNPKRNYNKCANWYPLKIRD